MFRAVYVVGVFFTERVVSTVIFKYLKNNSLYMNHNWKLKVAKLAPGELIMGIQYILKGKGELRELSPLYHTGQSLKNYLKNVKVSA